MKKLLFLLFLPLWMVAQSSTGQETPFDYGIKIETGAIQTVTNPVYPATMGTDGTIGRALAKDLPIDISPQPTNYTIPDTKLGSHLKGIDVRLGQIGNTTAGLTNRIYFTAVPTTIAAGTFYTSSATGKGAVSGVLQTVSNDDNVKNYFGQDVISIAQPNATTAPPGNYSGQLSVMVDNNSAQERFTVEIYKTDNNGTPIASGITGAPVGDLGVTVVAILDSGVLDLVASAVSNVSVSGNLASTLSLAVGERLRYHVSAQKVGTAGNAFMFSLFYGSDYSSYYDVTVTPKASTVVNDSGVLGGSVADALNTLNSGKANDADVIHKTGDETKSGILTLNNQLRLKNGTLTTPSMLFPDDLLSDTGINHENDGEIQFITDGELRTTINPSGVNSTNFNGSTFRNTYRTELSSKTYRTITDVMTFGDWALQKELTRDLSDFIDVLYVSNSGVLSATSYTGGATLTGSPTAPTATSGTNTTQIATTAFVNSANGWVKSSNDIYNSNSDNVLIGTTSENPNNSRVVIKQRSGVGNESVLSFLNSSGVVSGDVSISGSTTNLSFGGAVFSGYVDSNGFNVNSSGQGFYSSGTGSVFAPISGGWKSIGKISYENTESIVNPNDIVPKYYSDKNKLISYTFATLPASPAQGDSYSITDALAPAYLAPAVGGGSVYAPVVWNGTAWVCH